MSAIVFQIQSTLILAILLYGVSLAKRNNKKHIRIMSLAMIWDIILILQIELNRHAVEKVISVSDNTISLYIHVFLAVTTVILYGAMTYLGRSVVAGKRHLIPLHKKLGFITLTFRILTYITSFIAA